QGDKAACGELAVLIVMKVEGQSNLFQIVLASRPTSTFAGHLHGGQQQPHQDTDDSDHHQQLDQSERRIPCMEVASSLSSVCSHCWRSRKCGSGSSAHSPPRGGPTGARSQRPKAEQGPLLKNDGNTYDSRFGCGPQPHPWSRTRTCPAARGATSCTRS